VTKPHFFTYIEHRGFVALAFANNDLAPHWHGVHRLAHGLDRHVIGILALAHAHRPGRGHRSSLYNPQAVEPQLVLHHPLCHIQSSRAASIEVSGVRLQGERPEAALRRHFLLCLSIARLNFRTFSLSSFLSLAAFGSWRQFSREHLSDSISL